MASDSVRLTKALSSGEVETAAAIKALLDSQEPELVLRALVLLQKLVGSHGYDDESLAFISIQLAEGIGNYSESDMQKIQTVLEEWEEMKTVRVQVATYLVINDVMAALQVLVAEGTVLDVEMIGLVQEVIKSVSDVIYSMQEEA